jgi:hypothetical protein
MAVASYAAKLYYLSTGTRATWGAADSSGRASGAAPVNLTLIPNVKDVLIPLEKNKVEATTRKHGGWRAYKGTLKDAEIQIPQNYDNADASFLAILKAFLLGTTIALAILEGDKAVSGTEGLWNDFEVLKMEKGEKIDGIQEIVWTVGPADTAVPGEWVVVP